MAKYLQLSRLYLDDKDISDLVEGGEISSRFIVELLRRRGIFLPEPSKTWPRSELIQVLRKQLLSWQEVKALYAETISADREEKLESCRLTKIPKSLDLNAVIAELQRTRALPKNEIYVSKKRSDGTLSIEVSYTELDTFLARPFQKRERSAVIEVLQKGGDIGIRYSSNLRAAQIVEVLTGLIHETDPKQIETNRIEFPAVKDPILRSEFFTQLMDRVSGFRVLDAQDVKVDNRLADDDESEDPDNRDNSQAEAQAQVVKGLIKRAAFSGVSVLTSELYQQLRDTGYFITSLSWKSLEKAAEHEVEFRAEMADPVKFSGFKYDVTKVASLKPGDDALTISMAETKRNYVKRMEEAAFAAKSIVEEKVKKPAANGK